MVVLDFGTHYIIRLRLNKVNFDLIKLQHSESFERGHDFDGLNDLGCKDDFTWDGREKN